MTQSIADILDRAADLIEPEGAWTQGTFAKNKTGRPVKAEGARAVCWCAAGAIVRVTGEDWVAYDDAMNVMAATVTNDRFEYVSEWNDAPERTQAEVVAKLREAAAKARESAK